MIVDALSAPAGSVAAGWSLPSEYGLTALFRIFRAHERFAAWPFGLRTWDELTPLEQGCLIVYDEARQQQDAG